ncbi:hypothetical protein ACRARG_09200 [Pseudooceanicola sp. C21-150M6]|uniref:hypothetical protein n=1 Tax=Pseudooceanicola sp. C21-150M6 TaxID=3434355 RepID=UPI003D7FBA27
MTRIYSSFAVLLAVSTVGGCDAPTPGFGNGAVSRHSVEGSDFTVYVTGDIAESVRTNPQFAPRIGPLAGRGAIAMQMASGCRVTQLAGDAAVLVGRLNCGGRAAPACEVEAVLKGRRGISLPVVRHC